MVNGATCCGQPAANSGWLRDARRVARTPLRALREQLNARCPSREDGVACVWAKETLGKKLEQSIAKLSKGDRVLTTSGIVASVNRLKDANIVLEIADGVQVEFTRSAIAQVLDGGDRK
mgnify:CR=1 FL=1